MQGVSGRAHSILRASFEKMNKFWVSIPTANALNRRIQTEVSFCGETQDRRSERPSPHGTLSIFCGRPSPCWGRLGHGVPDPVAKLGHCCAGRYRFCSISLILKFVVIWNSPVKSVEMPHNVRADIGNGVCTPISHCFSNCSVKRILLDIERLTEYWSEPLRITYDTGPRRGRELTSWSCWSGTCPLFVFYIRPVDLRRLLL
jgi:hypothetical protein